MTFLINSHSLARLLACSLVRVNKGLNKDSNTDSNKVSNKDLNKDSEWHPQCSRDISL